MPAAVIDATGADEACVQIRIRLSCSRAKAYRVASRFIEILSGSNGRPQGFALGGRRNPRATFRTPITVEDVPNSRMIAYPFSSGRCLGRRAHA